MSKFKIQMSNQLQSLNKISNHSILEQILLWIIKSGLYAALLMPFIVVKYTLFPYVFPKAVFFQILVEVTAIAWVALVAFYPYYRSWLWTTKASGKKSRIIKRTYNWLNLSILAWLAVLVLSTLFGREPVRSFWGSQERMTGVFTILHFGLYYFMLISVMRSERDWRWFLRGVVGVGMVISAHVGYQGFVQKMARPQVSFGNPGIAGSFLLFIIFFVVILWLFELQKYSSTYEGDGKEGLKSFSIKTALYGGAVLVVLSALMVNGTRATFVGLLVAFVVGLLILPLHVNQGSRKKWYGVIGLLLLIMAVFVYAAMSNRLPDAAYKKFFVLERIRGSFTEKSRIMSWRQGLHAFIFKPIFGYGPENYEIAFNRYYNPQLAQLSSYRYGLNFDKAHNQPIENVVTTGMVGFISYLLIFVMSIALLRQSLKLKRRATISAVLILTLIGYVTHLFFTFDTPNSYLLFFIVLALVYYVAYHPEQTPMSRSCHSALLPVCAVTICAIVSLLLIYTANVKPLLASHNAAIVSAAAGANADLQTIFYYYSQALRYNSVYSFDIAGTVGSIVLDRINPDEPRRSEMIRFIADSLGTKGSEDWHRLTVIARAESMLCDEDQSFCQQALKNLAQAAKFAPTRFQIYAEEYVVYNKRQEYDNALRAFEKAYLLGYTPQTVPIFINIGFLYSNAKEYEKALIYYEKASELEPDNVDVLQSLLIINRLLGREEEASAVAERIIAVDPQKKNMVEDFLK